MQRKIDLSSAALHVLAMILMLCDHAWSTLFPSAEWLTCIGRIAFPIFAFMIVEGYFHTHDIKRYLGRLVIWGLISEIPFDLMYEGRPIYPYHQNVMWTFLIALLLIMAVEKVKKLNKLPLTILVSVVCVIAGFIIGMATFVDYYGFGILTVLVFYFFHGKKWWCLIGQIVCLYYINVEMLGGYYYDINLFGHSFELVQQGLALLSLIPIWLYRGSQGYHEKWFKYFCYGFYPGHIIVLYLIGYLTTL